MFWLPFGNSKSDNAKYAESERKGDAERRRRYIEERNEAQRNQNSGDRKKSTKEKVRAGLDRTEKGLDRLASASQSAYRKTEKALDATNKGANKFVDVSKAFQLAPDESLYSFKPETLRPAFGEPKERKGGDRLHETFALTAPRMKGKSQKSDPLFDLMAVGGGQNGKGSRRRKKDEGWSWI